MPAGYKRGSYTNDQRLTIGKLIDRFNSINRKTGMRGFQLSLKTLEDRNYTKRAFEQTKKRLEGYIKAYSEGKVDTWLKRFTSRATRDITKARQKMLQTAQKQGLDKYSNVLRFQTFSPKQNLYGKHRTEDLGFWLTSLFYESGLNYKRWRAEIYKENIQTVILDHWTGRVPQNLINRFTSLISKANAEKLFDAYLDHESTNIEWFYDVIYNVDSDIETIEEGISLWRKTLYG